MPHNYLLPMKVRIIISNPWRWLWGFCIFNLQQVLACTGRKVIFYDQVQRKDLNMVLNPKIQIQNITPISESKSMSKISSSTSKSQTSYSTLRPQHSGRHRSVHSLSTSSRSWIKPKRLPFHTGHQVTQRSQSKNWLNAQPLKIQQSILFGCTQTYWLWEVLDGTNILLNFQPFAHPWLLPWGAGCPCDWVRPWKVLTVVKIIGYGKYDFEEGNNYGNRRNINCWHQFRVPRVWPQLGHNSCHPLCCKTAHRFAQKYKDKETVWTWSLPLSM